MRRISTLCCALAGALWTGGASFAQVDLGQEDAKGAGQQVEQGAGEAEVSVDVGAAARSGAQADVGVEAAPGARVDVNVPARRANPDGNRWRYRWHNGAWWYWTPANSWVIWRGGRWVPYRAGLVFGGPRYYYGPRYYRGSRYYYDPGYGYPRRYYSGYRGYYYGPRYYRDGWYRNRGARQGAALGGAIGGAVGGEAGARIGAGIGAAAGRERR
jgi:hypothetical protein